LGFGIGTALGVGHPLLLIVLLAGSSAAVAFPIIEEGELFGPAVAYLIAWIAIADSVTVVLMPFGLTGSANVVSGGKSRSEFRPQAKDYATDCTSSAA
jgi:hypothetical protein